MQDLAAATRTSKAKFTHVAQRSISSKIILHCCPSPRSHATHGLRQGGRPRCPLRPHRERRQRGYGGEPGRIPKWLRCAVIEWMRRLADTFRFLGLTVTLTPTSLHDGGTSDHGWTLWTTGSTTNLRSRLADASAAAAVPPPPVLSGIGVRHQPQASTHPHRLVRQARCRPAALRRNAMINAGRHVGSSHREVWSMNPNFIPLGTRSSPTALGGRNGQLREKKVKSLFRDSFTIGETWLLFLYHFKWS